MKTEIIKKLLVQKNYKEAINILLKFLENNPNDLKGNFQMGKIFYELNSLNKSNYFFEKCNKIEPNNINILLNLAITLQNLGKVSEAKKKFLKILSINPKNIRSYFSLFFLNKNIIENNQYKKLRKLINDSSISVFEKSYINFIFSKYEKKAGNIKREIEYLNTYHQQCYESNYDFNKQSDFYYNKIISNNYNKIKFENKFQIKSDFNSQNHIFIIGLPRSGSTLVESIITHNDDSINSYGEFHGVNISIFQQIAKIIYAKNFDYNKFQLLIDNNKFQNNLIEKYDNFEKKKFLDKSLENFFNIDVILNFFPNAKFIHTYRDFNDSIIAIYQSILPELSWTHNIKTIINYANIYKEVMDYFKKKYPKKILNVELNKLTNDKENETKKILDFCKIKINENYLNFNKNEKLYNKTNSFLQVREEIKKYEDKKYKPYYYLIDEI